MKNKSSLFALPFLLLLSACSNNDNPFKKEVYYNVFYKGDKRAIVVFDLKKTTFEDEVVLLSTINNYPVKAFCFEPDYLVYHALNENPTTGGVYHNIEKDKYYCFGNEIVIDASEPDDWQYANIQYLGLHVDDIDIQINSEMMLINKEYLFVTKAYAKKQKMEIIDITKFS